MAEHKSNPLGEPWRSALSPHVVFELETMECQARAALVQAERAYEEKRWAEAEQWDVWAESLVTELEHRLEAITEDFDPHEGHEAPQTRVMDPPEVYLASQYEAYLRGVSHFRTWDELAGHLRAYLEEYSGAPVQATNAQILDAAHDASQAKLERLARLAGRAPNPVDAMGTLTHLGPDEVFAKASSHRAFAQVQRVLGRRPDTFYNLSLRRAAATYHFLVTRAEFEAIQSIKGVGRARLGRKGEWGQTLSLLG